MTQYVAKDVAGVLPQSQEMSIYFGCWTVEDYHNDFMNLSKEDQSYIQKNRDQINAFFGLEGKEDSYIWTYYQDEVFCFRPEGKVYNNVDPIDNKPNPDNAKSIKCVLVKRYSKADLPEVFANINSNQRYNRKTIAKLDTVESRIADYLVSDNNKSLIPVDMKDVFEYLSPIQFETLVFMIFNSGQLVCSSYRGGTLPDYDLRFKDGGGVVHYIQIKKKHLSLDEALSLKTKNKKMYVVHTGMNEDIEKNILGHNWIINQTLSQPKILEWLQFNLDFFII